MGLHLFRLFVLTAMAVEDALIAILCCREHSPGFFHSCFIHLKLYGTHSYGSSMWVLLYDLQYHCYLGALVMQ